MPLKGIPPIISPELLYALARMGHGDEILLADSHFPATSIAAASSSKATLIRADGHGIPQLLEAILQLIELDTYVGDPVTLMDLVEVDKEKGLSVDIWKKYSQVLAKEGREVSFSYLERYSFYERAKKAFIIVQTGETALYGNIILTNGIVHPSIQK